MLATTNHAQIDAWAARWPHGNFGVCTGSRSGVWVLDMDGEEGFKSLAAIEASIGALPPTWSSISGSGVGGHLWWRLPADVVVRNSSNAVAPKIDVRGENGQILIPPAKHKSGGRYRWRDGLAPDETLLAEAPEPLLILALNACKKTRLDQEPKAERVRRKSDAAALAPLRTGKRPRGVFAIIGDGEGRLGFHDAINRVCCAYFRQFGPDADREGLKAALREAIANAPTEGREPGYAERYLDDTRLTDAIDSARRYISKESQP